jgi:heme/copper-type cytochrome/quinol oxidase subunit 1
MYLTRTSSDRACAPNPWVESSAQRTSMTLEWLLPSPPQFHTFEQRPVIRVQPSIS